MNAVNAADALFRERFEACDLDAGDFHHREHLRLAYVYLAVFEPDVARQKMEESLRRFLAHLGAPSSKFHQTLTEAWLHAVRHFMERIGPTLSFADFAAKAAPLLDKDIMLTHYTLDLLWSEKARAAFVEPNLQPIPRPAP